MLVLADFVYDMRTQLPPSASAISEKVLLQKFMDTSLLHLIGKTFPHIFSKEGLHNSKIPITA
jgi:hypothetical protein|tara:strand:- start:320 stop:508 length:189 start_codon:yes stop_codon:yes gene_type:complete